MSRLTLIEIVSGIHKNKKSAYCRCACGNTKYVRLDHFIGNKIQSCGCRKRSVTKDYTVDSTTYLKLRSIWKGMRDRCLDKQNKNYESYGGRGIIIDDSWLDFSIFLDWAIDKGYRHGLTLDRIDNNGPYSPSNCQWASWKTQARNRRSSRLLTAFGETKTVAEWLEDPRCRAKDNNLLRYRLRSGWSHEEAISKQSSRTT